MLAGQRDGNAAAHFYRRGENCARLFVYHHNCVLEFGKVSRVSVYMFLFSLYSISLFWVLTIFFFFLFFSLFFSILKGDGGKGKMYSNIQNSLQVPALIKPCEAHY